MKGHRHALLVLGVAGLTFACSAPVSIAAPTTNDGQELFELRAMGGQAGCVTCHSLVPNREIVGPSLAGLSDRADNRVPGLDGDAYVRQSIVDPRAHVVDGFEPDKMPDSFGDVLTEVQLDALVDYLLEQS